MTTRTVSQRKSAVLILALLLMGAIVGSGIALSTVISDSGHQSQTLTDFISASLTADSGLERGLAVVKIGRTNATLANTVIQATGPNFTAGACIPGSTPSCLASVSTSGSDIGWNILRPSESVSFDILAPDPLSPGLFGLNANTITITGNIAGVGGKPSAAKLDISWVGLDKDAQPYYSGRTIINPAVCTTNCSFSNMVNLFDVVNLRDNNGAILGTTSTTLNLNLTRGFRIRISAVDTLDPSPDKITLQSVKQLRVSNPPPALPATGGGFPSRILITSTGTINKSQSQKTASVLWQLPSSPAFGYVLFTEGGIIPQ